MEVLNYKQFKEKIKQLGNISFLKLLFIFRNKIYDLSYKSNDFSILDRKSTRLNSSHTDISRMPSSA